MAPASALAQNPNIFSVVLMLWYKMEVRASIPRYAVQGLFLRVKSRDSREQSAYPGRWRPFGVKRVEICITRRTDRFEERGSSVRDPLSLLFWAF